MKERKQDGAARKLAPFRKRIDEIDNALLKLLARRFRIVHKVAITKIKYDFPIVQGKRVQEVIERNAQTAKKYGISPALVRKIYTLIIDEAHVVEHGIKAVARKKKS